MKKRKPASRKSKPTASVEHRLTRLEDNVYQFSEDMREIKDEIKNKISGAIDKTNADLKLLLDRKQGHDAVKTFVIRMLQLSVSLASFTWVIIQILKVVKHGI